MDAPGENACLIGIGCDTEDLFRLKEVLERNPRFRKRWFSASEIREQMASPDPDYHALCQFCLKEATIKACWNAGPLLPSSIEALLKTEKVWIPDRGDIHLNWELIRGDGFAEAKVLGYVSETG